MFNFFYLLISYFSKKIENNSNKIVNCGKIICLI